MRLCLFIILAAMLSTGCGYICQVMPGCEPSPPAPTPTPEPCSPQEPEEPCETGWRWNSTNPNDACEGEWVCTPPEPEFLPPTAAELNAQGLKVEIRPKREGLRGWGWTPLGRFGRDYYCFPEVAWPEACEAGREFGPVAPDGHPKRIEWEAHYMGQRCATVSYDSNEHMSFDPFISIGGVNQNHPRNVDVCGQKKFGSDPTWVRDSQGYIKRGQWSWATAHGNGKVCAEAADGVGRRCVKYTEP